MKLCGTVALKLGEGFTAQPDLAASYRAGFPYNEAVWTGQYYGQEFYTMYYHDPTSLRRGYLKLLREAREAGLTVFDSEEQEAILEKTPCGFMTLAENYCEGWLRSLPLRHRDQLKQLISRVGRLVPVSQVALDVFFVIPANIINVFRQRMPIVAPFSPLAD